MPTVMEAGTGRQPIEIQAGPRVFRVTKAGPLTPYPYEISSDDLGLVGYLDVTEYAVLLYDAEETFVTTLDNYRPAWTCQLAEWLTANLLEI